MSLLGNISKEKIDLAVIGGNVSMSSAYLAEIFNDFVNGISKLSIILGCILAFILITKHLKEMRVNREKNEREREAHRIKKEQHEMAMELHKIKMEKENKDSPLIILNSEKNSSTNDKADN